MVDSAAESILPLLSLLLGDEAAITPMNDDGEKGRTTRMCEQKQLGAPRLNQASDGNSNGHACPETILPETLGFPATLAAGSEYRISLETVRAAAMGLSGISVVITDRAGTVLWVNPAFTRITGYAAAEAVGQSPRLWSSGKHPKQFYKQLWDTLLAGRAWHGTIVNQRKDGSLYSEELTIIPILSETGEIANFISFKQDVTKDERATEMLRESEEKLRLILESTV